MRRKDWIKNKKKPKVYKLFNWQISKQLNNLVYRTPVGKNFKCSFRIDEDHRIYNIILELNNIIIHQFEYEKDEFSIFDCEKMLNDFFERIKKSLKEVGDFNWGNYERISDRNTSLYCLIGEDVYIEKNHNDYYLFLGKTSEPRKFFYKTLKTAEKRIAKYLKDMLADLEKLDKKKAP